MKTKLRTLLFCFFILLLQISCWEFFSIDQPDLADPNSTFEVPITVSLTAEGGSGRGHFGIRLPVGWTVQDTIPFTGVLNGSFVYSSQLSDSMEVYESSPEGYHWWIGVSDTVDSLPTGYISFTPRITTDDQIGLFNLDYMISDRIEGFGGEYEYVVHEDDYLISVGMPLSVTVTNTNDGGEGSLRQAMSEVSNGGEILFDLSYPAAIVLDSQLVVDRNLGITGPDIGRLTISGNDSARIFSIAGRFNINISNLTISGGNVTQSSKGGGIYCINSDLSLENVILSGNTAHEGDGGGLYCEKSDVWLKNVKIIGNSTTCTQPNANLNIGGNGGGIFCRNSNISFSGVTIANNSAGNIGGGILFAEESNIVFDIGLRSNIYFNTAVLGNDLFNDNNSKIHVELDTFSVLYPSSYYAYLPQNFTFDILNGKIVNSDVDLYVSVNGDNNNSGKSPSEAMKSVSAAFTKIMADSLHPHTIYIDNGIYSPSNTGENFPLRIPDYVTLSGANRDSVILDAENTNCVVQIFLDDYEWNTEPPDRYQQHNSIEHMTITGGSESGIQCWESILNLNNVSVTGNSTDTWPENYGGGITCEQSILNLREVILRDNMTEYSGGGMMINASLVDVFYSKILNNTALGQGGGVYGIYNKSLDDLIMIMNTIIAKNTSAKGGAVACQHYHVMLTNVTITENRATEYSGAMYNEDPSMMEMKNGIIWENYPESIHPEGGFIFALYSNIQGGFETGFNGNIDMDPIFSDTINYYLSENSPCIDAGDPDTVFNDREDVNNLGFALWPALGTVRNDMGAYGGHGVRVGPITDIKEDEYGYSQVPTQFRLYQNYPNPFNPSTVISWQVEATGRSPVQIDLSIYNILGQKVATLVSGKQRAGVHSVEWDASGFSSGVYYYQLLAGDPSASSGQVYREVKKMILLR